MGELKASAADRATEELFDALAPWIRRGLRELVEAHPGLYLLLRGRVVRPALRVAADDDATADDVTRARARELLQRHGKVRP